MCKIMHILVSVIMVDMKVKRHECGLLLALIVFSNVAFAAGLLVPQCGITLGEVQPGEAIEKMVVVSNDAERAIAVSRVKACCGGGAELPLKMEAGRTVGEIL